MFDTQFNKAFLNLELSWILCIHGSINTAFSLGFSSNKVISASTQSRGYLKLLNVNIRDVSCMQTFLISSMFVSLSGGWPHKSSNLIPRDNGHVKHWPIYKPWVVHSAQYLWGWSHVLLQTNQAYVTCWPLIHTWHWQKRDIAGQAPVSNHLTYVKIWHAKQCKVLNSLSVSRCL